MNQRRKDTGKRQKDKETRKETCLQERTKGNKLGSEERVAGEWFRFLSDSAKKEKIPNGALERKTNEQRAKERNLPDSEGRVAGG